MKADVKKEVALSPPAFSDEAIALHFAEFHQSHVRYVAAWSKWLIYDGQRWKADDTLHSFDMIREVCRDHSSICNNHRIAKAIASSKTVGAVHNLARADRRLAAVTDQWDSDPWLLNCPHGVIDLRTGKVAGHDPDLYLTKIASTAPDTSHAAPLWLKFLGRITGDNPQLVSFLQRVSGYALTGLTTEHSLFFCYGLGANGKSVFVRTLAGILDQYHHTAGIETFTASNTDRHPTDLAGLRGARLVTATETEEGRRWSESRLKALTGGDMIAARFMRQDFFEYTPQFKLLISGNHKPGLRSVDEAIRRRLHLIPFVATIPPDERDPDLADKLKVEWPGILAWMIAGCLEWQRVGLAPPEVVRKATEEYLTEEDGILAFLDDYCQRDLGAFETNATLFAGWRSWTEATGEYTGSQKRFSQRLEDKGFTKVRRNKSRGFSGIRLVGDSEVIGTLVER